MVACFRTSASIVFAAFFLALADDAISAPPIVQASKLAFVAADCPQCALPDVDDDEGNTLVIDQLNDISDSASNRVYLKEERSEKPLIGSLTGISCRRAEARSPPENDRRNSALPNFFAHLEPFGSQAASPNFHERCSTVPSPHGVLVLI